MDNWLSQISPDIHLTGHNSERRSWLEPLRIIYDHELVLLKGDSFTFEIDGNSFNLSDNSFIIVPPGVKQTAQFTSEAGGHRYWIHFDWVYSGTRENTPILTYLPGKPQPKYYRLSPDFVPSENIFHGPIAAPTKIFDLYQCVFDLFNQGTDHSILLARARMLELLIELLYRPQLGGPTKAQRSDLPAIVRRRLDKIATETLSLSPSIQIELEKLGYSYAHLCRSFSAAYGIAPLQYVTALRIERAKRLIRETHLSLSEIAAKVGFSSCAYFCRQFKKHTGSKPGQYRRNANL